MLGSIVRRASVLVSRLQRLTSKRTSNNYGAQRNKLYDLDFGLISIGLVSLAYFSLQTYLLDLYTSYRFAKDAQLIQILENEPLLLKPYLETIANANVTETSKDVCSLHFIRNKSLEPEYIGSFQSHYGVSLGLPRYYIDQNISRAEIGEIFYLDLERLTPEAEDTLRWTLSLSQEAQRYALLKCLHSASLPLIPYGSAVLLLLLPGFVHRFSYRLTLPLHLSFLGVSYICTHYLLCRFDDYQRQYGQWAVQHLESDGKQQGRGEFEQKSTALHRIVSDYSQNRTTPRKMFTLNKNDSLDWFHRFFYHLT